MKKIILLTGAFILLAGTAQAGILSTFFGNNNNGYYYPPNIRYGGYYQPRPYYNNYYYNNRPYNSGYYHQHPGCYPGGYYYNQPIIMRSKVNRKSAVQTNEKLVANQFSGIEKLEKQLLLQTYEYDSAKNRIERLEQRLFGASQEGDLSERFVTLKNVAKNYKAYNPNSSQHYSAENSYRPPIFTGSSGSSRGNTLLGNFRNQFIGMPTGITPAMDPAYMDYFEAERAMMGSGQSTDFRTNRGYYRSNTNRGVQTGVTILD